MDIFTLLHTLDDAVAPERCKLHLAGWNGKEDPLEVYFEGRFDWWQSWQTKKNFGRDLVVALIALSQPDLWLFAGVHEAIQVEWVDRRDQFRYRTTRRPACNELDGRLVVQFHRPGRQSYLLAEKWTAQLQVHELRAQKMEVAEFPGYSSVVLTKRQLDLIVRNEVASWKGALASVGGIYVIADAKTGKFYVGSATGDEGIWSRWCSYATTGHGGNKDIRALLRHKGTDYVQHFCFGILEIADTHASATGILRRESHWKELLQTREHGYNAN